MLSKMLAAVSAAGLCVAASQANAQSATAATAGGDVTADEATPLPPIVVRSPSEPPRAKPKKTAPPSPGTGATEGGAAATAGTEGAGATGIEGPVAAPFTLGQLDMIGGATITNEAMWTFNKNSLGQAVNVLPGVSWLSTGAPSINSSGARNEGDIFVRGFNRFQVPLSIDGVRIYLPADNRIDMNRFVTPDLSEVQVAKGYVSVLNGPGGEGGAINLVSRKPTKEIELEGRSGAVFNGDLDDLNQWSSYAYAGTRQKGYYAQVSGTIIDQDHFNLSDDFKQSAYATPGTPGNVPVFPYEDGGDRDRSAFKDWRVNVKAGITPNATDEYSINYTYQQGEKQAPLHTDRQAVQGYFSGFNQRYWDWPQWDISTLSWLSKTQLGSKSYVKTNLYYNTFDNITTFYHDQTYTDPRTDSYYEDWSYGGFVEAGTDIIPMNTLKAAIHYRRDVHTNHDKDIGTNTVTVDPTESSSEQTWSYAVENTFHATPFLDFVTGASYDTNEVLEADPGLDKPSVDAWNWQGAIIYSYSRTGKVHADISSRTRFPTLFERYSTRFETKTADPDLDSERSTNYEIGISDRFLNSVQLSSAVFYSDVQDAILSSFAGANGNNSIYGYNADGEYYGFELSADVDVMPTLRIGGNYTYMERDYDFLAASKTVPTAAEAAVAATELEGLPRHKIFLYAAWRATDKLTLTPSLEIASDRTALVTNCSSTLVANQTIQNGNAQNAACHSSSFTGKPNYIDIGAYTLLNFQAAYAWNENATLTVGATNILDQNYELAQGFPEAGRQFFANARVRF